MISLHSTPTEFVANVLIENLELHWLKIMLNIWIFEVHLESNRLTEWEDFSESRKEEKDTSAAFKDNSASRRQSGGSSLPASSRPSSSESTGIERLKQKSRWETEDFE